MKFDKFMDIFFRIISIITGVVIILGFCVSCFHKPISACAEAVIPDWAFPFEQYTQSYEERLQQIQNSNGTLASILNSSEYDQNAKNQALLINALQTFDYKFALELLQNWENNNFENVPDSVTFSCSGATGLFYDNNHVLHAGTVFQSSSMSGTLFESDLFTITFGFYSNQTDLFDSSLYTCSPYSYNSGVSGWTGVQCVPNNPYSNFYPYRRTFATSSYLTTLSASFYNGDVFKATIAVPRYLDNSTPPTILPNTNVCGLCAGSDYSGTKCLGYSSIVSLPEMDVNSKTPWVYYNDTLLPYIRQNFGNTTFDLDVLLVFPDGYFVNPSPDPTEPPTLPSGGIYIDNQYNIGINIIYPTDASGQPITDASGETVTETQYITDTSPLDGEYNFQMPTLPRLNIYEATLPNPDLSLYSDGIDFIWTACYNILTDTGLLSAVMVCFALALFGFILWKLGG